MREHSPYASEIYPFRFKLEPLTLDSIAKYVIAESPAVLPDRFPNEDETLLEQLAEDAKRSNDGRPVRHVGLIFARLKQLLRGGDDSLRDEDFRLDRHRLQAKFEDWGFEPRSLAVGEPLIVESFGAADIAQVRSAATAAVEKIGAQGEGFDLPPAGPGQPESHFERFLDIYKRFRALSDAGVQVTWPVAENANTTDAPPEQPNLMQMVDVVQEAYAAGGRITHPRARAWAHLFNLRYRLLLGHLSHFLRLPELYVAGPGPHQGDRTPRGLLLIWTFDEMRHLERIAEKLVQLPRDDPPGYTHAGPPFEHPSRSTFQIARRTAGGCTSTYRAPRSGSSGTTATNRRDRPGGRLSRRPRLSSTRKRRSSCDPWLLEPACLRRACPRLLHDAQILEEAVRGFDIRPVARHTHFWADKTRDEFLATTNPAPPVQPTPQGGFDFDPNRSMLIKRLEGSAGNRMPRFRPPVPLNGSGFSDWISGGCPDNVPAGEIGLRRERPPQPEPIGKTPSIPTTPLSFASDIRSLFRDSPDRDSMLAIWAFDLHQYEDVRDNADRIPGPATGWHYAVRRQLATGPHRNVSEVDRRQGNHDGDVPESLPSKPRR